MFLVFVCALVFVIGSGMGLAISLLKLVRSRKWSLDGLKRYAMGHGLMEEDDIAFHGRRLWQLALPGCDDGEDHSACQDA